VPVACRGLSDVFLQKLSRIMEHRGQTRRNQSIAVGRSLIWPKFASAPFDPERKRGMDSYLKIIKIESIPLLLVLD
jgi:hypothetical protein